MTAGVKKVQDEAHTLHDHLFVFAAVVGFAVAAGFAAGVAAGFVFAVELVAAAVLLFDRFVTEPVFALAAGVAVAEPAGGAGRAPLNSFGLSTTFFAR